ncbi:MAG: hypothetical protein PVH85_25330 [Desulfobacterales bacterium]|jgi:hypothetical protein
MDRQIYEREMAKAWDRMSAGDDQSYWLGYQRGLSQQFYGANFISEDEHQICLSKANSNDCRRNRLGQGYVDGYYFGVDEMLEIADCG